jgi:hypothetical protein
VSKYTHKSKIRTFTKKSAQDKNKEKNFFHTHKHILNKEQVEFNLSQSRF